MSPANNIKATAVILGGTGDLGAHVTKIFLSEYRDHFPTVRITTRDPASTKAKELAAMGAEVHAITEPMDDVVAGATVIVNVLPTAACLEINKALVTAMVKHGVPVYFPSDFASDYTLGGFEGFMHTEWINKTALARETAALSAGAATPLKAVTVFNGAFLSWLLDPYRSLCANVHANTFTALGDPHTRFAATALPDIARAVARLALLALDPATRDDVPAVVHVYGDNVSVAEIRDAVARVKGVEKGPIEVGDVAAVKQRLRENQPPTLMDIVDYARVLVGQGNIDYSENNQNELVNPGQSLWKWRTVEEELRSIL
ncbi:uncharacterized protein BXZ73DRAFT_52982 [Epithele typhae]|uniref:uncharacterized protein n=1 Tax=Epithele typhae TaxID=378194 RepID=UPI002007C9A7|nr:uncharacterized protein BXZ73DRAFT_52982 [Epithele typhae]KAH9918415.1 hypothetical protein BXZ73DRAFT_52982 [Epithele typhae]